MVRPSITGTLGRMAWLSIIGTLEARVGLCVIGAFGLGIGSDSPSVIRSENPVGVLGAARARAVQAAAHRRQSLRAARAIRAARGWRSRPVRQPGPDRLRRTRAT